MIYELPQPDTPVDQCDLIDECPIVWVPTFSEALAKQPAVKIDLERVIVLSQTCDLHHQKSENVNIALVDEAKTFLDKGTLKPADIKGPLRSGRIWGLYFLPANAVLGLAEMIVDLRRLHTVRLEILRGLCRAGQRKARLRPPYREHLAKHFADSFSRIGLPQPYETL
jgi:hypothetical protein